MSKKAVPKILVAAVLLILSLILLSSGLSSQTLASPIEEKVKSSQTDNKVLGADNQIKNPSLEKARVIRAVDGDTLDIDYQGKETKLRYIGVDTPETVDPHRPVGCFGKEASDENKALTTGKEIYLSKDLTDKDKFDRLLRYVYLKLDNGSFLFVNDYLVREGFAKVDTIAPNTKFVDRFTRAETEAKVNKKGLWANC